MGSQDRLIDKLKIIKLYLEQEKKADMAHTIGEAIETLQDAPKNDKHKCEQCKWLSITEKSSLGRLCENPNKKWQTNTAMWKQASERACKEFEERED